MKTEFLDHDGDVIGHVPAILGFTRLYGLSETGQASSNSLSFDVEGLRLPPPASAVVAKELAQRETLLATGSKQLKLSSGAGVVLGRARSGKTLLADTLRKRNPGDVTVLRYREPEHDSLLYEASLVEHLYAALNSSANVIFIDSLRTTFYVSGGATGKGGVNMGIFALLTAYDILARRLGKVILFALNPMTTDDDAISFYLEASRGSVTHTLHAVEPTVMIVSSRSFTSRDDARMKYDPPKVQDDSVLEPERAPRVLSVSEDSIASLYISTSR